MSQTEQSSLFGSDPAPVAPVPPVQPKASPAQAPAGVAERGQSYASTVFTWLLIRRRDQAVSQVHEIAAGVGLDVTLVGKALEELYKDGFVGVREENGARLWSCAVKSKPDPKPVEITPAMVKGYVYCAIENVGAVGITLAGLSQETGMEIAAVEALVRELVGELQVWRPQGHMLDGPQGQAPGYVARRFYGRGIWEGRA